MRVRETFPDRILDEADEVVLVDLAPEELHERIRAGKVYEADRVDAALENFFRLENLAALRELALREVAEDVEARREATCSTRSAARRSPSGSWCWSTPGPSSQRVLRRAWRSANGWAPSSTCCGCGRPTSG